MKKLQNVLLLGFALAVMNACNYRSGKQKEYVKYDKDGLSFSLPKYWKVTKDKPIEGTIGGRLVSVSNEELFSKEAYLVITKMKRSDNLAQVLEDCVNSMQASHRKRKIEFGLLGDVYQIKIDTADALKVSFETRLLGTHNNGSMTVFNTKNNTCLFVFNGDVKDKKENAQVLDSVLKSFKLN